MKAAELEIRLIFMGDAHKFRRLGIIGERVKVMEYVEGARMDRGLGNLVNNTNKSCRLKFSFD